MRKTIDKIVTCSCHDPFTFLGAHFNTPQEKTVTLRTFQPYAQEVRLLLGDKCERMSQIHRDGIFEIVIETSLLRDPELDPFNYQYQIHVDDGSVLTINDPYRFLPQLGDQDSYLFNAGRNYKLYNHLGAHLTTLQNIAGTIFRVWAPNATSVSVTGNFNRWDPRLHQMRNLGGSGVWELFIPQINQFEVYKFSIKSGAGEVTEKADPFQFYGELRPRTGSVTKDVSSYTWSDEAWQKNKQSLSPYDAPLSIYEVHPGSWKRDPADPERFLTFRELAQQLIPYVKQLGFTHIELMPIMEHPLDESWGYQVTAPFSVTSRYGTPEDFVFFVDSCHQNNLGVILDWVPAHFPKDGHSLGRFDGSALYEHEDIRLGSHPEWGTYIYNYGRNEVSNFLIANALFWLHTYHLDGLRVDAVASMLYLDYARRDGEWIPNRFGGRENLEAIEFIKHLTSVVYDIFPNTLLIAEESTSFFGVSKPVNQGGLGFGFKWNMGWMNDILSYFKKDPFYRKFHHNALTFSIMYAFSENFVLPLSHDEVVHGKGSLINKMPGDEWQKFANLRLLFLTMWLHPGKKLLFMGGEFGQWSEWYCKRSLDWHLLQENNLHQQLLHFVTDLNGIYKENASLWQLDFSHEGFQWLDIEDKNNSVIVFARYAKNREDHLVCILNYTPQTLTNYTVGLPQDCQYTELFCSDSEKYGGSNNSGRAVHNAIKGTYAQADYHTILTVPPLAGILLQPVR